MCLSLVRCELFVCMMGVEPTTSWTTIKRSTNWATYTILRKTLESNQMPEGTSRLAGGPYPHQGLSSVVLIIGLEPITSDVSGRDSDQLSYMSGCGTGRTRTFNHSINSRGLYHWATSPNGGRGKLEPPSPHGNGFTDRRANQLLNSPLLYPKMDLNHHR